ncbi:MAG: glycosyltransferase family 2 protein [Bacteroidaceae bacterium]|nr:glycosyltransferase family 2 protein [Bacteroidaceae bacterium]
MKAITVFTPTYNRKHTICRTYESLLRQTCRDFDWLVIDDGSCDGTREWIEGLGEKVCQFGKTFDWMGRPLPRVDDNHFVVMSQGVRIEYVYKVNGGLYTGYNVAYSVIATELCVCVDSDDYMPDDAVSNIVTAWNKRDKAQGYCGLIGLDFNVVDKHPIGGYFPKKVKELYFHEMRLKKIHSGDTKPVMLTALMKEVAPMVGFEGEKNFNPVYMLMQVCDNHPLLVVNNNLCWVEYQVGIDSMSQGIYRQYVNSPRSFAQMRLQEMRLKRNTLRDRFRSCIHYVSSCLIARDSAWLRKSERKVLTLVAAPLGLLWYYFIMYKNRKV